MIEWNEMHLAIRDAIRRFIEAEVKPHLEAREHEGEPPYAILRKMINTFGMADLARSKFAHEIAKQKKREEAAARGEPPAPKKERGPSPEAGNEAAMQLIPIIELCRYSPGMVTALGVSMGLTSAAILNKGR